MNVKHIVENYLRANVFDGLACDGCGCGVNDLMPCAGTGAAIEDCKPAVRKVCDGTCWNCQATEEEAKSGMHACFRAMQTQQGDRQ